MKLTFKKGGIHPAENKTASTRIEMQPLPMTVCVPLSQHIGAPAEPTARRGDKVERGELIGRAAGTVSANVHAPISGTVVSVDNAVLADGRPGRVVIIKADDESHAADTAAREEYWKKVADSSFGDTASDPHSPDELRDMILGAGIAGMGGATFPTHVKLKTGAVKPDIMLINGCECEPYLMCDDALMRHYGLRVAQGSQLLARAAGAEKTIIAIEDNKPEAIDAMRRAAAAFDGMEVVAVKTKYPQGGEKQLIAAVTGRYVASGALPISTGVVVDNVATAFAVWQAVATSTPLIERVITVTGDIPAAERKNYLTAIGTPLSELPFTLPENAKAILGGPMMGRCAVNLDAPVTKGTSGLLLKSTGAPRTVYPCIRCGACVDVCPMGLEPYLLATYGRLHRWDDARQADVADCLECGSCSYACPSNRPILDFIRIAKKRSR